MGEKQKNKGEVFVAFFSWPRLKGVCCRRLRLALAAVAAVSLSLSVPISVLSLSLFSLSRALALVHAFKLRHSDYDAPRRPATIEAQGWSAQGLESARRGRADRENSQRFFVFFPSTLDRRPSIVFSLLFLSLSSHLLASNAASTSGPGLLLRSRGGRPEGLRAHGCGELKRKGGEKRRRGERRKRCGEVDTSSLIFPRSLQRLTLVSRKKTDSCFFVRLRSRELQRFPLLL